MSSAGEPAPPPPGGVLWSLAGDIRGLLMLPAALTLQVAHPAVGAGVDEHSVFRTDPWGRGERSLSSLQLWVYGGRGRRRGGAQAAEAAPHDPGHRHPRPPLPRAHPGELRLGARHGLPRLPARVALSDPPAHRGAGARRCTRSGSRSAGSWASTTGTCRRRSRSSGRTTAGCWPRRWRPPSSYGTGRHRPPRTAARPRSSGAAAASCRRCGRCSSRRSRGSGASSPSG